MQRHIRVHFILHHAYYPEEDQYSLEIGVRKSNRHHKSHVGFDIPTISTATLRKRNGLRP
jgi:hypothetical protein